MTPKTQHPLDIELPTSGADLDQNEEWCNVTLDGTRRRIRLHDYPRLYSIPGLYEELIYERLKCTSPDQVCGLLADEMDRSGPVDHLNVLDLGAGNGMVGEKLKEIDGVDSVVGVDIIEEAREAAERDRPGVYEDYHVCDLTDLDPAEHEALAEHHLNALVCVAALGFGDIPTAAFLGAYEVIDRGGWVAFNIKEEFLEPGSGSDFAGLIANLIRLKELELLRKKRYQHRLSITGEPIHYVALVARKRGLLTPGEMERLT